MFSPSGKVLVVEDDESVRDLCCEVLESAGYTVETAANGLDGLGKLRRFEYDLVVSDLNMPELDGMKFLESASKICPGLDERFLLMSGYLTMEAEEAIAGRGVSFLSKPFRITEFIAAVERLMRKPLEGVLGRPEGLRSEGRVEVALACEADPCRATMEIVDISPLGAKALYEGAPLMEGESLWVRLDAGLLIERKARVVWSRQEGPKAASGLRFEVPMPASSIIRMRCYEGKACSNEH